VADSPDEKTQQPESDQGSVAETVDASSPENDSPNTDPPNTDPPAQSSSGAPLGTEEMEKLLDQASESLEQAAGEGVSPSAAAEPYSLSDLSPNPDPVECQPIDLLGEVEMDLRIELGRTQMRLEEVLQLRGGSVVALDKLAGDPVDVFVNGRLIARGEVLVMNDNFCIRVTELVGA
jgi:flagellar motor switch protein FliN/FliY